MAEPEHISSIISRVIKDLIEKWERQREEEGIETIYQGSTIGAHQA